MSARSFGSGTEFVVAAVAFVACDGSRSGRTSRHRDRTIDPGVEFQAGNPRKTSMTMRTRPIATGLMIAVILVSTLVKPADAALQGRDLDGNLATIEAYYDTVLDITWLADANYAQTSGYDADGRMNWATANTWAADLSFTDGVDVYDDWRLPTLAPVNGISFNYNQSVNGSTDNGWNITSPNSEMAYMYYVNLGNPAFYTVTLQVSGCYVNASDTCLDNVGPFSHIQASLGYWTNLEYAPFPINAWAFGMGDGSQGAGTARKTIELWAWAVSPGDVGAVPEADAFAMLLAGLGLLGMAARRRKGRSGHSSDGRGAIEFHSA
jgi:hypothetical protein